ncbi:MAG: hypothetical protein NTV89_11270 [Proteobacteria bacterium]|nr:hypothetical protein [Pseudomonadota bacterium]
MPEGNVPAPTNPPHILSSSATLIGICFLILCSINALGAPQKTLIDEIAGSATIFFLISSVLSIAFFAGLLFLTSVSVIIVLGLLR